MINYKLYTPKDYNHSDKLPLIIYLHSADERGNELEHLRGNLPKILNKHPAIYNSFILMPQCPKGKTWTDKVMVNEVISLLRQLLFSNSIDNSRIYIIGYSMGGYGAWNLLTKYKHIFAAGIPICGGGNRKLAKNLINIPIWTFHCVFDFVVPFWNSSLMVRKILK